MRTIEPSVSSRFSKRVHRVLGYAHNEAIRRGANTVNTLDVVTGFAQEGHGLLARVFASWHVALPALCHELGAPQLVPAERVSWVLEADPELQRALQCASAEADSMGEAVIGNKHLLLGILGVLDSTGCKFLAKKGMDADAVRARLAALTSP